MPFSIRPLRRLPLTYWSGFWSLTILLLLSSGPAYAEWVAVAGNDDPGMTAYIDPDTIRRNGNLVKVWQLNDFKTIQTQTSGSFLSAKIRSEYDCAEERSRLLALRHFSGNMGRGNVAFSIDTEEKWSPIIPESVGQNLWKVACGKK